MPSNYCQDCDRWFSNHDALTQHLTTSSQHRFLCKPCDREFVNRAARTAHWEYNDLHTDTYCLDCKENYDTREDAFLHYTNSAAHKDTYDARCDKHFDNYQERLEHKKANPAVHHLCLPCDLDYTTSAELRIHWKQSERHKGLYDARCNILFDTEGSKTTHQIASAQHNSCEPCNLDYATLDQLRDHWRTTEVHSYTYDKFCQINFANPQILFSHKKVTPSKHHLCLPCALDFQTHGELKDHLKMAEIHKSSFCSTCEVDFGSASNLKLVCITVITQFRITLTNTQHVPIHRPKPLTCYSCGDETEYASISALFVHLESGSCAPGWTIQHINTLISQSPESKAYVIKEREPWLLAGPPRLVAQDSDRDPTRNCWRCPICKKPSFLSKPDLTRHLQEKSCYQKYPNVLKCDECDSQFTKFSNLLRHVETDNCPASIRKGNMFKTLEHVKVNLMDHSTQQGLTGFRYELQSDPARSKRLIVKVESVSDLICLDQ